LAWAATRTKGSYLRAKYYDLVKRIGKKRALIAVGHKILNSVYFMLRDDTEYKDLGENYLRLLNQDQKVKYYTKKIKELGYASVQIAI
jgi:transposase